MGDVGPGRNTGFPEQNSFRNYDGSGASDLLALFALPAAYLIHKRWIKAPQTGYLTGSVLLSVMSGSALVVIVFFFINLEQVYIHDLDYPPQATFSFDASRDVLYPLPSYLAALRIKNISGFDASDDAFSIRYGSAVCDYPVSATATLEEFGPESASLRLVEAFAGECNPPWECMEPRQSFSGWAFRRGYYALRNCLVEEFEIEFVEPLKQLLDDVKRTGSLPVLPRVKISR